MIFQRNINRLPLACPQLRTWLVTQACALTRNRTCGLLVCRITANPLSHAGQSRNFPFGLKESSQPLSLPLKVLFTSQALNRDYFSKGSSQSLSNVLKTISQCCACTSTEHIAYTVCFHSQCCAHYHLHCGRLFSAGTGTAQSGGCDRPAEGLSSLGPHSGCPRICCQKQWCDDLPRFSLALPHYFRNSPSWCTLT